MRDQGRSVRRGGGKEEMQTQELAGSLRFQVWSGEHGIRSLLGELLTHS